MQPWLVWIIRTNCWEHVLSFFLWALFIIILISIYPDQTFLHEQTLADGLEGKLPFRRQKPNESSFFIVSYRSKDRQTFAAKHQKSPKNSLVPCGPPTTSCQSPMLWSARLQSVRLDLFLKTHGAISGAGLGATVIVFYCCGQTLKWTRWLHWYNFSETRRGWLNEVDLGG